MTAAQFEAIGETEAEMILRWRFDELVRAGYDVGTALMDDGSTGDEGRDLGFITLVEATRIAAEYHAELDVDGPTREEWDAPPHRSFLDRLLGR